MKLLYLSFFFSFILAGLSRAQDIHWSQFNDNQLFQNPGHAGHFDGDFRFIGNYRDQWRSVTVPFSTTAVSVDGKFKNFGWGINMFNDQAGDGKFRTVEMQGNISYAIKLTQDSTHVIRPGVNFGMNHRQINWDALYFDNQYNGYVFDPGAPTNEMYQNSRKTNLSLGAGMIYEWYRNNRFKLLGFLKHSSVIKWFKKSSIAVVCSRNNEPFGRTALEASSCGCAVIISNNGGLPEASPHAIKLKNLSVKYLEKNLIHLIRNKKKLLKLQRTIFDTFDLTNSKISKKIDLYRNDFK